MANIPDIFSKLKTLVRNDKDDQLSTILRDINKSIPYTNKNIFSDLLGSALTKSYTNIEQILAEGTSFLSGTEQERISRYSLYTSIYKQIPFCKRAIKVIVANILSPDTVSKLTVNIDKIPDLSDGHIEDIDIVLENARTIAKLIKLPQLVRRHITEALYKGDSFIALVPLPQFAKTVKETITESISIELIKPNEQVLKEHLLEQENKGKNRKLLVDLPGYENKSITKKITDDKVLSLLETVKIMSLKPERVIAITYEDLCFGYLILPDNVGETQAKISREQQLLTVINRIMNFIDVKDLPQEARQRLEYEIKHIFNKANFSLYTKVMYLPPEFVQHIKIESPEYEPYGESVFSGLDLDSKIFMALKTALAVHRINSASDKRVVAIEIGLPRSASNAIQSFKNAMRKRRVTLDNVGTLDAIPAMIGTFETIMLPMRDGRRFIEFDRLDTLADVTTKAEELKTLRDFIISATGVPPLFLGIDEVEKKATASHQNIIFTRDIVDYQEMFTRQFNEFIKKVYKLVIPVESDYELLDYITINFPPPKNLQIEMTSELVGSISSVISSLKELGIPQEYLIKEFLSNLIDLDKVKEYKQKESMEKGQSSETEMGGGMGGTY